MVQLTKKRKMTKSKISSKSKKKFNKSRKNGMKTNNLIGGGGDGDTDWFRKKQKPRESPRPRFASTQQIPRAPTTKPTFMTQGEREQAKQKWLTQYHAANRNAKKKYYTTKKVTPEQLRREAFTRLTFPSQR